MAADSMTSDSSKTLSIDGNSWQSPLLLTTLAQAPHEFLQPKGNNLHDAALGLAKRYLDPLKAGLLETILVEGFDVDQVWEQVRPVVEVVKGYGGVSGGNGRKRKAVTFEEEEEGESELGEGSGSEEGSEDEMIMDGEELSDEEEDIEGFRLRDDVDGLSNELEEEGEEEEGLEDEDLEDAEEEDEDPGEDEDETKELVEDVHGLNDGFFSIDDFNRQTELMELQDTRSAAQLNLDDEDEIDVHADPATYGEDDDDEEDEDDGEEGEKVNGLALGKRDMKDDFDNEDDEDLDLEGGMDMADTSNIKYKDFFAPPAKKGAKKKKEKKHWRDSIKKSEEDGENEYEAMESDMARVQRDLFEDEDDEEDEDVDMDEDPADPLSRRSAHQKRQAALTEEIRQLEAENVAKKDWTLAGEARSRDRPLNALLEEDLDFERVGKPVPVITQEVTESLEDMIKRRILAAEFDEVIKRRPDADVSGNFRRGRVELDDSKPQQSLAEVYEKEHLQAANPDSDAVDEKLEKEHKEIEALFADVSRKLDSLTSWHYTPKPPKPSLTIVADAPAISMEEAQPSAAGGGMAANVSMLAPQEIYKAGAEKAVLPIGDAEGGGREIVSKGGAPISTREMTSEEKKRRRKREKTKIRKRNAANGVAMGEVKAGSRKDVVDRLKRGNVKVIGKGGETRDVEGNLVEERRTGNQASSLRL